MFKIKKKKILFLLIASFHFLTFSMGTTLESEIENLKKENSQLREEVALLDRLVYYYYQMLNKIYTELFSIELKGMTVNEINTDFKILDDSITKKIEQIKGIIEKNQKLLKKKNIPQSKIDEFVGTAEDLLDKLEAKKKEVLQLEGSSITEHIPWLIAVLSLFLNFIQFFRFKRDTRLRRITELEVEKEFKEKERAKNYSIKIVK